MPEFRKWILALAGSALFLGVASAQVNTPGTPGGQFTCNNLPSGSVTPTLRAEGFTELTGDIVISCTGGNLLAQGAVVPTANITVFLNTAVTSRLLSSSVTTGAYTVSEATLLIDEPGASAAPFPNTVLCGTPAVGAGNGFLPINPNSCAVEVGAVGGNGYTTVLAPGTTGAGGQGPNAFQGLVVGNQVAFFGIPVLPPVSAGNSRIFRITNIRANANGVTAGGPTPGSVVASISTTISTIPSATATVGFVQQGLSPTNTLVRNSANGGNSSGASFPQCNSVGSNSTSAASGGGVQFQENFATAFKTRVVTGGIQNIPGTVYNTESGFTLNSGGNTTGFTPYLPGYADFGTRLKAVFSNVPSGVSIFVSTRDLTNSFALYNSPVFGGNLGNSVLVVSETASDGGGQATNIPTANPTGTFQPSTSLGAIPIAPVSVNSGTNSGTAVWEVTAANPNAIDTFFFGVYVSFTSSPTTNIPSAPSTMSVTLSFAPTPSGGAFTAAQGAAASSSLVIPRFSDSLDITKTFANFVLCTTNLLYPYVINVNGFDTGIAIANTTTDPFGTTPQSGTCQLTFYGSNAPSAAVPPTPTIATGTVYANLASTLAPGFDGYMIAVCNFQLAHGFAFVSDVGARNLAMGYLALIVPTPRNSLPEALNN